MKELFNKNINKRKRSSIIQLLSIIICFFFISSGCAKSSTQREIEEGWGETQSLSVATDWAGIDFESPAETFTLNDGRNIELTTYRYRTGIVEALYKGEDYEVVFRRSDRLEGAALAEDDRTYSKEWESDLNGIKIHCFGDGTCINTGFFNIGDDHYTITAHIGSEGIGLTEEELASFIKPLVG